MRVSVQLQVGCRENERKGRGPYGGNHDKYLHGGFEPVVCAMWRALAVIVTRFPTGIKDVSTDLVRFVSFCEFGAPTQIAGRSWQRG